ncbi:MAG: PLP-dependent aminotransferase family protein [Clostridia bacterium]|nr:PLP-dependent aminotransferase family protein [Clostridia bacterium]
MIDFDPSCKNKYYSLYKKLRGEILRGKFKKGERLPSKRVLSREAGVSVVTVQLAYEQLEAEGYIRAEQRRGYFVEEVNAPSAPAARTAVKNVQREEVKPFRCDLVKGNIPADMFPFSTWARLMREVLSDCGEHLLERVPCAGDIELREALSDYLYRSRGIDADPRYVVVGAGAEYLYGVIVQLLGRDKIFAVENPGYGKISSTYALNGAKFIPVAVGARGMSMENLCSCGADAAHVSPSHQFPTGAVMPVTARAKLIEWANGGDRYVIEDDYDSEFRLSGRPLQSTCGLCPEKVIYMNTFSKSLAPSMRLGYMVLPPALYEKYIRIFSASANSVPLFEQKALAKMLNGGYFERHISRLKNYYRGIRRLLLERLDGLCAIDDTGSGLHVIARFEGLSDEEIKKRARDRGVNLKCVTDYLIAPLDGFAGQAVINYSGLTEKVLNE